MLVASVLVVVLLGRACATAAPVRAAAHHAATSATPAPVAAYAAGACQTLAPTGKSQGRTLFIDAGHGGPDPGVLGTGRAPVREAEVALAVAQDLARQLRADGYRVVLSRTGETSVQRFAAGDVVNGALDAGQVREDLQARVRCADDSHAMALLSVHFNGYQDASVGGSQTIYDGVRPFSAQSQRLASSIQSAIVAGLGLADRGVLTDDSIDAPTLSDRADQYGHLLLLGPAQPGWLDEATSMPGVLVEPLFLTASREAAIASSQNGQHKIAQALKAGLEAYLAE